VTTTTTATIFIFVQFTFLQLELASACVHESSWASLSRSNYKRFYQ